MNYADVVRETGVTWCQACPVGDHEKGWANIGHGIVHWRDRRLERRGLRLFLKLVASIVLNHNRGQPEWQILYEENVWAFRYALRHFGMRFRSTYADEDRARAAWAGRNQHLASTHPTIYRWISKKENR